MEREPASKHQITSIFIGFQEKNRTRMILTNHAIPPTHQLPTLTPSDTKLRERIPFRSHKHCITNILGATLQSGETGETSSPYIFPAPPSLTNMALVRGPLSLFIFYSFFILLHSFEQFRFFIYLFSPTPASSPHSTTYSKMFSLNIAEKYSCHSSF